MLRAMVTDADRAVVARQLGREPRTLRRVAVRCPFGAPAVTEQSPYGADGEPFPTTYYLTCRHLVAAVSRLEAAGGVERWSEATRSEPALAASLAAGDEEQRRLRTGARRRRDRQRRRRLARLRHRRLAAGRQPQVPPRARRVRARASRLRARRAHPRGGRAALAGPVLLRMSRVEVARQEWEEGSRRLEAAREDARRYGQLLELLELVLDELRKRVGQTYTLAELVAAYGESERWAREVLAERASTPGWTRDLTIVLAAAFDAYQRGAIDYEP